MYVHKILYVFLLLTCSQCVGSCKWVHPHLVLLGRLHLQIKKGMAELQIFFQCCTWFCYSLHSLLAVCDLVYIYTYPFQYSRDLVIVQVDRHRDNMTSYILFLRITPFLPNWFINVVSPVINVPLWTFFFATVLGKLLLWLTELPLTLNKLWLSFCETCLFFLSFFIQFSWGFFKLTFVRVRYFWLDRT